LDDQFFEEALNDRIVFWLGREEEEKKTGRMKGNESGG
jgi:hypothetical protein